MRRALLKTSLAILFFILLATDAGLYAAAKEKQAAPLGIEGALKSTYSLAGETAGVKEKGEAVYLAKGEPSRALSALKDILIDRKSPARSFTTRDPVNIIIFRGVLQFLGKIELIKMVSKDNSFEIYANYVDLSDPKVTSEPAAIIPLGKLPKGKYSVSLYVGDQLHKKIDFKVNR